MEIARVKCEIDKRQQREKKVVRQSNAGKTWA